MTNTQNSTEKHIIMDDDTYEPQVSTVRLHPNSGIPADQIEPAVVELGKPDLVLEFDILQGQNESLYLRIVHCTYDWKLSALHDLDFLDVYNEFPINDFTYSVDTQTPYVHYRVEMPSVKLSGNYLAIVYRSSNRNDYLLTHRFMVYEKRVQVARQGNLVGSSALTQRDQQINFNVLYGNATLINPMESVHVVLRQNQRWDNLASDLRPSFIREDRHILEYHFFDEGGGILSGGNEFRFFDLRSIRFPGQNVGHASTKTNPYEAFLQPDASRNGTPYSEFKDLDGSYVIDNLDHPGVATENYVNVHFQLQVDRLLNSEVYVNGALTSWQHTPSYKMNYDSAARAYKAMLFLKQGWYNYEYVVKSSTLPWNYFEGSHFQTENFYELFVYYHTFERPMDLLIGYQSFTENQR